ncbi:MAG: acyltransferase [Polaribacter sp.]
MYLIKPLFKKAGRNVIFDPNDSFSYSTIKLNDDIFIAKGAKFSGEIEIKSKVMFGPNVTIIGGDHDSTQVGRFMINISNKEKTIQTPTPILIETDTWIGANSIILKGVILGEGCIIGAGSLVTRNVAPYSIVIGSPAKHYKYRFSEEEIILHRKKLKLKNTI